MLETWPVCSPHARARILRRDATAARLLPGIHAVLMAEDVPGANNVGGVKKDEILLADEEVYFHGHIVALVVGQSQAACRAAAEKVVVEYEPLPPVLTIPQALAANSFHNEPNFIRRGDVAAALEQAPFCLDGEFELAGQEHFYLETNAAWAGAGRGRHDVRSLVDPASVRSPASRRARVACASQQSRRAMSADGRRIWRQGDAGRHARPRWPRWRPATPDAARACA